MSTPSFVVITPVRNEDAHIGKTIASMESQTSVPQEWVIVDDGSTDGTSEIVSDASSRNSWIKVVRRRDRGRRESGGGVVEAFYEGYASLADQKWDFIVKLDADLSFEPHYFRDCLKQFELNPRLGIGGGLVCRPNREATEVDSPGDPPFHVRGATKIYRRACWVEIGPLVRSPGWDTIDELKANLLGWNTLTFEDMLIIQHKPTGAADGNWGNWFKNGLGCYQAGYDPVFMLGKCIKRSFMAGGPTAGIALASGFINGYIRRTRSNPDARLIRYVRMQQRRRLLHRESIYR